jgi:hypothetical protein
MMMIATGGDKCCLWTISLLQLETEHATVEFQGALQVRDL